MKRTIKGNLVPEAGDSLLETWPRSLDNMGTIVTYGSQSAFRDQIARAVAAGYAPTASNPWYGDIGKRIWRADGSKDSNGQYILTPLFEITFQGAGGWAPLSTTGTLRDQPLIMKMGTYTNYTSDHNFGNGYLPVITFDTPFPNNLFNVQVTPFYSSKPWEITDWNPPHVDRADTRGFRVMYVGEKERKPHSIMWLAIGS